MAAGGPSVLKAFSSPCRAWFSPHRRYPCLYRQRLAGPAQRGLRGSWVAPKDAVAAGDWDRIEAIARDAAGLSRSA